MYLKEKVVINFKNNPSIHYVNTSKSLLCEDLDINYDIKVIETLGAKPLGKKEDF